MPTFVPASSLSGSQLKRANKHTPLVAFTGFHSGQGGIGHVMVNIMNGLVQTGLDVDLLISSEKAADLVLLDPGIRIFTLGKRSLPGYVLRYGQYLKNHQPQAVISNKEWSNRYLALACRWTHYQGKLIFRIGNPISVSLLRRPWIKRTMRKAGQHLSYRQANLVIGVSQGICLETAKILPCTKGKIVHCPNPIICKETFALARKEVNHPWLKSKDAPLILGVGRLARQKNFPLLIKAVAEVNRQRPVRLIILGEGKERRHLEQLIHSLGLNNAVSLPGFVDNPYAFMSRADLLVLSSNWEGSPNVLIEALALGLPVIATNCHTGPQEILSPQLTDYLVPVADQRALTEKINKTLDSPPCRAILQDSVEKYHQDRALDRYQQLICTRPEQ